jgi:hypothetical protein
MSSREARALALEQQQQAAEAALLAAAAVRRARANPPPAAQPAPGTTEPERVLGVRKLGGGQQFEIQWRGQQETTWEAVSRFRRQHPQLVQAFELQQQQQQQQPPAEGPGATDTDDPMQGEAVGAQPEGAAAPDNAALQRQVAELALLVKQQAQRAEEHQQSARQQRKLIEQLRAPPAHSSQSSVHVSPQRSPHQESRSIDTAAAAAASQPALQSRFARKEPRAQDLQEYDGAAGAKLDTWLDELSLARMLYELNAREALRFAVSRLRGAALQWWLALSSSAQDAIGSTDALATALRARFQPVTAARTAREQLDKLSQGSRSVNDYISDFQRLRTQLPSMAEDDALYAFERGLRRDLAEKLRVQGVETVQAAIAMAARVGGLTQTAAARPSLHQMDMDDNGGASLDDRIQQAVLNAMHARDNGGMGAKTQTHRGYTQERGRGGGRGGLQNGRGGRFGGRPPTGTPTIPGVPAAVVEQRRAAGQCYRCGSGEHQGRQCPNATSASQQGN